MPEYHLYLESGPRHLTTMVHVLDLLGCVANGPTMEQATDATPDAIRSYLATIARYGEPVDPSAGFTTSIAAHVVERGFIGQGDPPSGFEHDFQPLSPAELEAHIARVGRLGAAFRDAIRDWPEDLWAEPESGRPAQRIVEHVAAAHCAYLRYTVGAVEGLRDEMRAIERTPTGAFPHLDRIWELTAAALRSMSEEQRGIVSLHGKTRWTARRGIRRMLEHCFEHLRELDRRRPRPSA